MSKLHHYWKELQRRHVVKAGIAYLVAAWLIIQVLSIFIPAFDASSDNLRTAIIVLGIGFPIWLVIAWMFDFSSEGIKKTEDVPYDPEEYKRKNTGLNRFIIGGLSIAVILLVVNTLRLSEKVDSLEEDYLAMDFTSSLAILPLEDISPNKDQRYFSDGLSRSIYDQLARFKDLKLVSTQSSFQYRERDVSIEVIAQELDVRYILDGSVQLFENKFRVSIDLIDTEDDTTIWSKTFNDDLQDVYSVYDEVSAKVGEYLKLTINVPDVRLRKVDPESYQLYLKAVDTSFYYDDQIAYRAMDSLIRRSISIDPEYAPSYAVLSQSILHNGLYFNKYPREEAIRNGKEAAKNALELDPELLRAYTWMSNWEWHDGNAATSMDYLNKALELYPNESDLMVYAAHQMQRTNQIDRSYLFSKKGVALNPQERGAHSFNMDNQLKLGLYEEALNSCDYFYELDKTKIGLNAYKSAIYRLKGDLEKALEVINDEPNKYLNMIYKIPILSELGRNDQVDSVMTELNRFIEDSEIHDTHDLDLAWLYACLDDHDQAFQYLDKGYDQVRAYLEWLFALPDFENLHDDTRWNDLLDRLGKDYNYDFKHAN